MAPTVNRAPSGAVATGTGRRTEAFQPPWKGNPLTGWPPMAFRFGIEPSIGLPAAARIGAGGEGWGQGGASNGLYPLSWIEGNSFKHYAWSIPMRHSRNAGELCSEAGALHILRATLVWSVVSAPGFDSGFIVQQWSGSPGSIVSNITLGTGGVNARGFGVCKRSSDGAFGFAGVVGNAVVFTPLVPPSGTHLLMEIQVEYRIYDATDSKNARLEVWINNIKKLSGTFVAGNPLGLPYDYPVSANAQYLPYFSVEAFCRLWCGNLDYSCGPADSSVSG